MALGTAITSQSARAWWEQRRLRYNFALVVAGVLAFAAHLGVVERGISKGTMPGAEITFFTIVFQAFGYLLMMGIANLCYNLGQWSESVIRPTNIGRYRRVAHWIGFWFSALLPFAIPALVAWSYVLHPGSTAMPEP